jgi:membrane-bound ClpP family serine protease
MNGAWAVVRGVEWSLAAFATAPFLLFTAALILGIVLLGLRTLRRPPVSGPATLIGLTAEVRVLTGDAAAARTGKLWIPDEYWDFIATRPVAVGASVHIRDRLNGRLEVEPIEPSGG